MMGIKNILVPTDYSVSASAAFSYARHMASRTNASVHLLHIEEGSLMVRGGDAKSGKAYGGTVAEEGGVRTVLLQAREAAPAILEYQASNDIDLIVMGTHGHKSVARFLSGSDTSWTIGETTERILQASPCPVLTVGPRADMRPEDLHRMLVLVEEEDETMAALQEATSLAALFDAELDILYRERMTNTPRPASSGDGATIPESAVGFSYDWLGALEKSAPRARLHRVQGRLHQAAVDFARKQGTHLIVSGSGQQKQWERLGQRSTAGFVVRAAPCPVYTVRKSQAPV